jgi:hypothetical protein
MEMRERVRTLLVRTTANSADILHACHHGLLRSRRARSGLRLSNISTLSSEQFVTKPVSGRLSTKHPSHS